jgi:hypothetical protein
MRYRNRLAGILVSLALMAGVSAAGVGGAGAQAAQRATVTGWPALGHFQSPVVGRPQPAPEHRVPTLGPHISGTTNTTESTNWSGYVDTGSLTNTFSGVGGEWTVPAVQPSGVLAASSQWIGIDGAGNNSLIQTGTSSITQNGGTQYFAWYEILPAASIPIGVVSPGDDMQATIIQDSPGSWTITIADNTSQSLFSQQFAYGGPASSAEWIVEDPTVSSGQPPVTSQPPLANFGTTPFSNLGVSASDVASTGVTPIDMIDASSNIIAYPSTLSASGFTVSYATPLSITTTSLPTVDINTSYSQSLTASGGALPYAWSITSGTLPTGLMLNASSGAITGMPTVAANQNVTFEVTDSLGQHATATLSMSVFVPAPFSPLAPVRICDTRAGNPSGLSAPANQCNGQTIPKAGTMGVNVAGSFGVPANATAVVLNVTVVNPSAPGIVTAYPSGAVLPVASNINYVAGEVVPNLVEVGIGSGGDVSFYSSVRSDLVVDVEGYTGPSALGGAGAGLYKALPSPARICDTRAGNPSNLTQAPFNQCNGGTGNRGETLAAGGSLPVQVAGVNDGIPAGATAAVFNVTVANPSAAGILTVFPQDKTRPAATSNVNYGAGQVTTNRVIVPLSTTGALPGDITVYSSVAADVIVDVSGYYSAANGSGSQFTAEGPPVRICDTRLGNPSNLSGAPAQCNGHPIVSGTPLNLNIRGLAGVPPGATAVALNLTGIQPSQPTFLTVFPGPAVPVSSDLNPAVGEIRANMVVATINPGTGQISIFNLAGAVNVVVDVLGWYS